MYRWLVGNLRLWSAAQTLVACPLGTARASTMNKEFFYDIYTFFMFLVAATDVLHRTGQK